MRKLISAEFKQQAISLVQQHNYSQKQAADSLNVSLTSISRKIKQFKAEQNGITPKSNAITAEQGRIQELEKPIAIKVGKGILKKVEQNVLWLA